MSDVLRAPNGNAILLTPRTASHSLALAAMQTFWPEIVIEENVHPAWYFGVQEMWNGSNPNLGIIVRNPIERFRSGVARKNADVAASLTNPIYGPLPQGSFVRFFKFETQLQAAAEWLGITVPLPQEDATEPTSKPNLSAPQQARVREIYAADLALWESL